MYSRGERKDAAVSVDYHFKIKYKLGTSTRLMKPPAGEIALHKLLILKCPQNSIALGVDLWHSLLIASQKYLCNAHDILQHN